MSRYMYTAVSVANRLPGVSSFLNGTNHVNMKYVLFIFTMWLSLFFKLPEDIVKQFFSRESVEAFNSKLWCELRCICVIMLF